MTVDPPATPSTPSTPHAAAQHRSEQGGAESPGSVEQLSERVAQVRQQTEALCAPLTPEDMVVQAMADASPAKWHLAHTSWFFETFVLKPYLRGYTEFHSDFAYLFNSYYNAIGERQPRPKRGLITRPGVDKVFAYRNHIDESLQSLLAEGAPAECQTLIELGLHHEQQHQELILTDIKYLLSCNPLKPSYCSRPRAASRGKRADIQHWDPFASGTTTIGHSGPGFCYDNETPQHTLPLPAFELADRLVTNGEYLDFVEDAAYSRPELWLSDGWDTVQKEGWQGPLYWQAGEDGWWEFTLDGLQPLDEASPVCHVSFYEAEAFARWCGARLPSEFEWERAARQKPIAGNFLESGALHPRPEDDTSQTSAQLYGDVWEWTASPYLGYPGYRPASGAIGEYNGKFMCNQFVLRGGSCATSHSHIRPSYRNFFYPQSRWQFSGLRLARDAG